MIGLDEMNEHKRRWAEHQRLVRTEQRITAAFVAGATVLFINGMAIGDPLVAFSALAANAASFARYWAVVDRSAKHAMEPLNIRGQW